MERYLFTNTVSRPRWEESARLRPMAGLRDAAGGIGTPGLESAQLHPPPE
ncbi:MAG: hypothetical protein ACRDJH_24275 [Thermomicrobiales bacterium]